LKDVEAINAARRAERDAREAEEKALAAGREAPVQTKDGEEDGRKELRLVIKGDVSGSVEAVAGALEGIGNNLAGVKIIHSGVGDVTESDVQLAQTAQGILFSIWLSITILKTGIQASSLHSTFLSRGRPSKLLRRRGCRSAHRGSFTSSWTMSRTG
jgi:hypothetical protein